MPGGGESALRNLAGDLGADLARLDEDRTDAVVRARLANDLQEVQRFQFDGVLAFIVNGRVIVGAQPAQDFVDVIDAIQHQ